MPNEFYTVGVNTLDSIKTSVYKRSSVSNSDTFTPLFSDTDYSDNIHCKETISDSKIKYSLQSGWNKKRHNTLWMKSITCFAFLISSTGILTLLLI
jgi:hypothetical protein